MKLEVAPNTVYVRTSAFWRIGCLCIRRRHMGLPVMIQSCWFMDYLRRLYLIQWMRLAILLVFTINTLRPLFFTGTKFVLCYIFRHNIIIFLAGLNVPQLRTTCYSTILSTTTKGCGALNGAALPLTRDFEFESWI